MKHIENDIPQILGMLSKILPTFKNKKSIVEVVASNLNLELLV